MESRGRRKDVTVYYVQSGAGYTQSSLPLSPTGMRDCDVRLLWEMLGSSPVLSKIRMRAWGAFARPYTISQKSQEKQNWAYSK